MQLRIKPLTILAVPAAIIVAAIATAFFRVSTVLIIPLQWFLAGSAFCAAAVMALHYRRRKIHVYKILAAAILLSAVAETLAAFRFMGVLDYQPLTTSNITVLLIRCVITLIIAAGLPTLKQKAAATTLNAVDIVALACAGTAAALAALEYLIFPGFVIAFPTISSGSIFLQLPVPILVFIAYRFLTQHQTHTNNFGTWLALAAGSLLVGQVFLGLAQGSISGHMFFLERSAMFACYLSIFSGGIWTLFFRLIKAEQRALNLALVNEEVQQEIEERLWTEELLRESRLFAESIVETIREPLLVVDSDLKIIRANRSFFATFALTSNKTLYRRLAEIGQGQWNEKALQDKLVQLVNEGSPFENYEMACEFEEAGPKTILVSARRIHQKDAENNLFLVAMYDITELTLAQEEARRLARGVEAAAESFLMTNLNGVIQYVNPAVAKLTGYAAEELIGKKPNLFKSGKHDGEHYESMWQTILSGKVWSGETTNKKKDGALYDAYLTIAPLFNKEGALEGFVSVHADITELKLAEEELAIRANELARSNSELEQFAYIASHDLQEPLRMVSSYCQLLQRRYKGELGADADEFIEYAVDGAKRMQNLINDLLDYSRVGTHGEPLKPTDCGNALGKALSNLKMSIADGHAKIVKSRLPKAMADETQLIQLFQNLIANAIKFSGDKKPEVRIGSQRRNGEWVFSIKDNGIGIDQSFAERIFVIFQRLHTQKEYPGTGIGLALCKKIVERHGGCIWVDSKRGEGSTFYFTLPGMKEVK